MPNYEQAETTKAVKNAYVPLIGFIVMLIIGVLAWFVSPMVKTWLTTTSWNLASSTILPISFPGGWDDFTVRIVVALGTFLMIFALAMIPLVLMMGSPMGETDINLQQIRKEKEAISGKGRKKKRR
jgi:hypothetical protein